MVIFLPNLTPKQRKAAMLLAFGKSLSETATVLHITRQTLSEWRKLPDFQSHLQDLLQDVETDTKTRLIGLRETALDSLATLLTDPNPAIRLKAVQLVLSQTSPQSVTVNYAALVQGGVSIEEAEIQRRTMELWEQRQSMQVVAEITLQALEILSVPALPSPIDIDLPPKQPRQGG